MNISSNKENKIESFYVILEVFLMIFLFLGLFLFSTKNTIFDLIKYGHSIKGFFPIVWIYIIITLIYYYIAKYLIINREQRQKIIILLLMGVIPRIIVAFMYEYIPTNDFVNYMNMTQYFLNGDYSSVADIANGYQIPTFAGLAVLNGIIAKLFSEQVIGFQIANSIITSLIAVFIYLLGENFRKGLGVIASILYILYPSNIIMTQVVTNQHGATLMYLICFYIIIKATQTTKLHGRNTWKVHMKFSGAGCFFLVGHYFHPSSAVSLVAIIMYMGIIFIRNKNNRKTCIKMICALCIFISTFILGNILILHSLQGVGLLKDTNKASSLSKVVVGLNQETQGEYSYEDYFLIHSTAYEDQATICFRMIQERTTNLKDVVNLIIKKVEKMWWSGDTSFYWYTQGIDEVLAKRTEGIDKSVVDKAYEFKNIINSYALVDYVYVYIIYALSFIGLIYKRFINKSNEFNDSAIELLLWVLMGWIGAHTLIEIQPRYRYFGMPIFFIFAALGIVAIQSIYDRCKRGKDRENIYNVLGGII